MKRIVLIQPKTVEYFWSMRGLKDFVQRPGLLPPLGLATLAALTPPQYHVTIIDEEIAPIDFRIPCDIVGITGNALNYERIMSIASAFRQRGVLTVGGGICCTCFQQEAQQYFDVVITGEAERTWPQFLADWEKGQYQSLYQETALINLEESPLPRWDLIPLKKYASGIIQTSRGCPHNCEFCNVVTLFGRKVRHKNHLQVMQELERLVSAGALALFFADENFTANRPYVKELLAHIIDFNRQHKYPVKFVAQTIIDIAEDDELVDLLQEANVFQLVIGIETPRTASLMGADKHHNLKQDLTEAVQRIQSRGICVVPGMIVGFDTDDRRIFAEQKHFLQTSGLTLPMLNPLIAFKGTRLWERLHQEGRLLPDMKPGQVLAPRKDGKILSLGNFRPLLMTQTELAQEFFALVRSIYSSELFQERFATFLNQIDIDKMSRVPALGFRMQIRSMGKWLFMFRGQLLKFYIFQADKEKRHVLWFVLKQTFAKGLCCLPIALYILANFASIRQFMDRTYPSE